jgi:trans-aconitate 2-methyltransferase
MLRRARADHPDLRFFELDATGDLSAYKGVYDLVFSNACLHWVPDHRTLFPRLLSMLRPGGQLAVQMPLAERQVMYRDVLWPLARAPRWTGVLDVPQQFYALEPFEYAAMLESLCQSFELWETTYHTVLDDPDTVVEWFRGTGLRPYLESLPPEDRDEFERELRIRVREHFAPLPSGKVDLQVPRLFLVAAK